MTCTCDTYGPATCVACALVRRNPAKYGDHPSHRWSTPYTDYRCWNCDCRPGSRAAQFPCGEEPTTTLTLPYALIDMMAESSEREPGGLA